MAPPPWLKLVLELLYVNPFVALNLGEFVSGCALEVIHLDPPNLVVGLHHSPHGVPTLSLGWRWICNPIHALHPSDRFTMNIDRASIPGCRLHT